MRPTTRSRPRDPREASARWILAAHILVASAVLALFGWRAVAWHRSGWTGLEAVPVEDARSGMVFVGTVAMDTTSWEGEAAGPLAIVRDPGPARAAGLEYGDEILEVTAPEGSPARNDVVTYRVLRRENPLHERPSRQWSFLGIGIPTTFVRHVDYAPGRGERWIHEIPVILQSPFEAPSFVLDFVLALAEALLFLAVGALVLTSRPADERARVFHALCLLIAATIAARTILAVEVTDPLGRVGGLASTSLGVVELLPFFAIALLLHLTLVFPRRHPKLRPGKLIPIYAAPLILLGVATGVLFEVFPESWFWAEVLLVALPAVVSFLLLYFVFPIEILVNLVRSYRRGSLEERRRIRWPAWGTALALVGAISIGFLDLAWRSLFDTWLFSDVVKDQAGRAFLLLIPVGFAVGIARHRVLGIDRLLRRTASYGLLTLLVLGIYLLLAVSLGGFLIDHLALQGEWVVMLLTVTVATVLVPVRSRLQRAVERRLFPHRERYPRLVAHLRERSRTAQDEGELLQEVCDELREACLCSWVAAWTRDRGRAWRLATRSGLDDDSADRLNSPPLSVASDAPARVLLLSSSPEHAPLVRLGASLLIAAGSGGRCEVVLGLSDRLDGERWTQEDREFLQQISTIVSQAVIHRQDRERSVELDQARRIQEGLLPSRTPSIPGYEIAGSWHPAREVAGDGYDFVDLPDDRLAISVADVAGKGLPAALLMSNLHAAVRAVAGAGVDPAVLCAEVDRILGSHGSGRRFVTFFVGYLDPSSGRLTYCDAGHAPPMLLRSDGSIEELVEGGPVLGAFRAAEYTRAETTLRPGDRLLLYTDGATEARDGNDAELGEEGLRRILRAHAKDSAEEIRRAVVEEVSTHSEGHLLDDLTVVVLAATGSIEVPGSPS